jgi:hypothetical protein
MNPELDLFLSTDKLWLPYVLYKPQKHTEKVLVWLHGMGDSAVFYSPARINALAESLAMQNIALFAFNNRGAHNAKSLKQQGSGETPEEDGRYQGGTHYELLKTAFTTSTGPSIICEIKVSRNFTWAVTAPAPIKSASTTVWPKTILLKNTYSPGRGTTMASSLANWVKKSFGTP